MIHHEKAPTRGSMRGPGTSPVYTTAALSSEAQRARILAHLREHHRLTTLEARQRLSVMHPAARVRELREMGHRIETLWREDHDAAGNPHRVAEYVLMPAKVGEVGE